MTASGECGTPGRADRARQSGPSRPASGPARNMLRGYGPARGPGRRQCTRPVGPAGQRGTEPGQPVGRPRVTQDSPGYAGPQSLEENGFSCGGSAGRQDSENPRPASKEVSPTPQQAGRPGRRPRSAGQGARGRDGQEAAPLSQLEIRNSGPGPAGRRDSDITRRDGRTRSTRISSARCSSGTVQSVKFEPPLHPRRYAHEHAASEGYLVHL